MTGFVLLGRKKGSNKLEHLYTGNDGTELHRIAHLARLSDEYEELGKLANPSVVRLPTSSVGAAQIHEPEQIQIKKGKK